jgi:hypothetical protein
MLWYIPLLYLFYYYYNAHQTEKNHQHVFQQLKRLENKLMEFDQLYPLFLTKKDIVENEKNIENKLVGEETPDGSIQMSYDDFTKSFWYWSKKPIAYKYLNAVARKYVIYYECKDVYVNKHVITEKDEKSDALFLKKKIIKPVLTNANIFKWAGKEFVKEEIKEKNTISYAEFMKKK